MNVLQDESSFQIESIYNTFVASVRCVGTACTLAGVGIYLHRNGFVVNEGKRTLALISQQATFPLFLFTKIIYCNQNWSDQPCPDVTKSLSDVWMLLFWPIIVVGTGILTGWLVAKICNTPKHQIRAVLAACGFGNSTGLPITILTVIHTNFPDTSDLGRIDPTLFLSVYLLLYPVLQWGIGGWLLAPEEVDDDDYDSESDDEDQVKGEDPENMGAMGTGSESSKKHHNKHHDGHDHVRRHSIGDTFESMKHNVVNNKELTSIYFSQRHGLTSNDEGMYMSDFNLVARGGETFDAEGSPYDTNDDGIDTGMPLEDNEDTPLITSSTQMNQTQSSNYSGMASSSSWLPPSEATAAAANRKRRLSEPQYYDVDTMCEGIKNILRRCLQPPVVGAILGITVAATPLRGVLVDLEDRASKAPLQWLFDGLYSVGLAAVPINMMILGCNLSASQMSCTKRREVSDSVRPITSDGLLPWPTMVGIVIGKMLVQPFVGILLCYMLKTYVWDIPDDIDGSFYLVLMIVFLTPTANNVMVMVELSGSGAKEGIAAVIAMQYAVAPIILSLSMTVAVGVADDGCCWCC